ncbi:MAG: hypothetical protein RLY31_3074 [Bacteroidota bacterium]
MPETISIMRMLLPPVFPVSRWLSPLVFLPLQLVAQSGGAGGPDLFPVAGDSFLQGFSHVLSGTVLDYPPELQRGKVALQLMPGQEPIGFSSEWSVCVDRPVTFVWQATLLTGQDTGRAVFELAVNDTAVLSFQLPTGPDQQHWSRSAMGFVLSFRCTEYDAERARYDGYQFLTVPAAWLAGPDSLLIRLSARQTVHADTYIAYQNHVETKLTVRAPPALRHTEEGSRQPVRLDYTHVGPPTYGVVSLGDSHRDTVPIRLGRQSFSLWLEPVSVDTVLSVVLETGLGMRFGERVRMAPVRPYEVYFLPHSHVDVGFTHLQQEVLALQWRNIRAGIDLARKTADYPEEARYKWNVEVLWPVEGYLDQIEPAGLDTFLGAVRAGWIGLDALYGSELTGIQRPEELMRITQYAQHLQRTYGLDIPTAMITDVPGYAWGTVPALLENGVRFLSMGPNHMPHKPHGGYQVGHVMEAWGDKPFYWVTPSGTDSLLCWMSRHGYSWFHDWLLGQLRRTEGVPVLDFLSELSAEGYPYDIVQLRYSLADNGGPDDDMPDFIREWNEKYESPRFRMATTAELFRAFEAKYGGAIPSYRGDMSPYWEDGVASSAAETALNRRTAERLVQAAAVWAMVRPYDFPAAAFDAAWRNVLLFSEHTWGAFSSKSDPDGDFARALWQGKRSYALAAADLADSLLAAASAVDVPPAPFDGNFWIVNTTSWPRRELVILPGEWAREGDVAVDATGACYPLQRLFDGDLCFRPDTVGAFEAAHYRVRARQPADRPVFPVDRLRYGPHRLDNGGWSVSLSPASGDILQIRNERTGTEWVDTTATAMFNQLWYTGANAAQPQTSGPALVRPVEQGPWTVALLATSTAPGCDSVERLVRLVSGEDAVQLENRVAKRKVLADENLRFAFPFRVADGQVRIDLAWAEMRPESDQLPGANKNFFCAQHFVDISNDSTGVTWVNVDAPLVETGGMHGQAWMGDLRNEPWFDTWTPSTHLYSWVMNNVWFVNYKGFQEGPVRFRYAVQPHGRYDAAAAKRFAIGKTQPLQVLPVREGQSLPPASLGLQGRGQVMVTLFQPARSGGAFVVRLFNPGPTREEARLRWKGGPPGKVFASDGSEKRLGQVSDRVLLEPWEVRTFLLEE